MVDRPRHRAVAVAVAADVHRDRAAAHRVQRLPRAGTMQATPGLGEEVVDRPPGGHPATDQTAYSGSPAACGSVRRSLEGGPKPGVSSK